MSHRDSLIRYFPVAINGCDRLVRWCLSLVEFKFTFCILMNFIRVFTVCQSAHLENLGMYITNGIFLSKIYVKRYRFRNEPRHEIMCEQQSL